MLHLPEVLKATEQLARERDAGQVSLFGGSDSTGAPALALELPQVPEWPLLQRLQGERATLGHYLSGHPLAPSRHELSGLVGHDLGARYRLWNGRTQEQNPGWPPETP